MVKISNAASKAKPIHGGDVAHAAAHRPSFLTEREWEIVGDYREKGHSWRIIHERLYFFAQDHGRPFFTNWHSLRNAYTRRVKSRNEIVKAPIKKAKTAFVTMYD